MAHTERYETVITLNTEQAKKEIDALDTKIASLRKKQEGYAPDSKQFKKLATEISKNEQKLKLMKNRMDSVNDALRNMSTAKPKQLKDTIKDINALLNSGNIERGSQEWKALTASLKEANTELMKIKNESKASQSTFSKFFKFLNDSWGGIFVIMQSVSGISTTIRKSVDDFATMEEAMADVRKYTGMTENEVHDLNDSFKKMDTRTTREQLNELAGAAGRLGITAKEGIIDFVEAGNMIQVALGDDLGEGAIDKVGKLAMAFGEDEKKGLRGAMEATGSAINELAQNSSAQAGYLVDFTARVAGFGKQLGLTQAQIMGFGAVMDENLLRDEMAATAFGNMLTKMQTDTAKFAKIAGMDFEKFSKLLKEDANGAILALADNLKRADPQTMMKMLDDMGLDGSRAVGVLSTLADKIDDVRARQELATKAYQEGTSVGEEYRKMNETVQAQIEKAKKEFHEISVELGERLLPIVKYTITGGSMMVKFLSSLFHVLSSGIGTITSVGLTIAALTAYRKADVIWSKLQVLWNDKLIVGLKGLKTALATNPWTAALIAISAVVGVIIDLKRHSDEAAKKQRELTAAEREHKAMAESMKAVNEEANRSTAEEITKLNMLRKTLEDNGKRYDERKKALSEIKKIVPSYHGDLTTENKLINNNTSALDDYISNLMTAARAQAAFNRMVKLQDNSMTHEELLENRKGNLRYANQQLKKMGVSAGTTFKYADWNVGYAMYDEQGKFVKYIDAAQKKEIERYQNLHKYNVQRISEEEEILSINRKQSEELQKIVDKGKTDTKITPGYTYTPSPKGGGGKTDNPEKERIEKLKKQAREEKAVTDGLLADNMLAYSAGLKDYRQFTEDQLNIRKEGLKALMKVWETEPAEYAKIQKQLAALILNGDDEMNRLRSSEFESAHMILMQQLERDFNTEGSAIYHNERAYNEARFQEEMAYLEDRKELTREGSLERMQVEWEIEDRMRQHQLESQLWYQENLENIKTSYLGQSSKQREEIELNTLEALHQKQLLSEEEYQRARMAIKAQYADGKTPGEKAQEGGENALKVAQSEAKKSADSSADLPIVGEIALYKTTMDKLKEMRDQDRISHQEYLAAKGEATKQFCENMASQFQAAYQSVNQIMSAASQLYSAQAELETAEVKKKYEKQIAAAGNNQKRVKMLQEKQAKEEAAIKTKYNRKQVKIQIAQALAQTATNALNAYGSAAAIPIVGHILAPIAAAMAVAAGMIQVAAIKKQAAAQEAGYYEGGFTGGRRYRREAGVVHEGEFVANHQAVNNPNVLPFLNFLDQAQRNNTIGNLTQEDISRQLGNGGTMVTPIVNVNAENEEMRQSVESLKEAADGLRESVAEPLPCYVVMDGPNGLFSQLKHYEKLKNV